MRSLKEKLKESKNLSLINLYREAREILEANKEDKCPLCESEIKRDILLEKITESLEKLRALDEENELFKKYQGQCLG